MKVFKTIFIIIFSINLYSQEYYFTNAINGLNVRSDSSLDAKKTAKIPFGVIIQKISDTNKELTVNDKGKLIKGRWVKIKYDNYFFLVSEETEQFEKEGYIFDGYLKKLKIDSLISSSKIEKLRYEKLLKTAQKKIHQPKKIRNLDSIKTILKNRVVWGDNKNEHERSDFVKSIITERGQKLILNDKSNDYGFTKGWSGYYPEYDILVLEGGHSSDMCFSIKTGETDLTIGNPLYMIPSPKNTYRLNGYFSGQECISYFFQKKVNGEFIYLTEFNGSTTICTFKEFYWINESKFIYKTLKSNGKEEYFVGEIKNNT